MKGAVLAVGTELLLGDVVNSNAAWLGRQLRASGVEVVASEMVADEVDLVVAAVRRAAGLADVVVVCGGLGPTRDDLTRDAVAVVCDAPLARDPEVEQVLRAKVAPYLSEVPEDVWRQADVPRGATVLDNPAGTAPGLWLEHAGTVVIALPGPPHELQATAAPVWARLAERAGGVLVTRQVLVAGIPEAVVAERVDAAVPLPDGVAISYLAGGAVVRVRFTSTDPEQLQPLVAAVDALLGEAVLGHDDETLEGVVHGLLGAAGQTLAVAESLTGGLLAAELTRRPGASSTFRGGVVVYATDLKGTLAGVPDDVLQTEGAVSKRTAAALAEGVRERLGADWGLAVTGVAGPEEQEGKPVGTVHAAVAGPDGEEVRTLRLPGDRDRVRALTVTQALDLLRRHLVVAARKNATLS